MSTRPLYRWPMSERQQPDPSLPLAGEAPRHFGLCPLVRHLVANVEQEEKIIAAICHAVTHGETASVQTLARELAAARGAEISPKSALLFASAGERSNSTK